MSATIINCGGSCTDPGPSNLSAEDRFCRPTSTGAVWKVCVAALGPSSYEITNLDEVDPYQLSWGAVNCASCSYSRSFALKGSTVSFSVFGPDGQLVGEGAAFARKGITNRAKPAQDCYSPDFRSCKLCAHKLVGNSYCVDWVGMSSGVPYEEGVTQCIQFQGGPYDTCDDTSCDYQWLPEGFTPSPCDHPLWDHCIEEGNCDSGCVVLPSSYFSTSGGSSCAGAADPGPKFTMAISSTDKIDYIESVISGGPATGTTRYKGVSVRSISIGITKDDVGVAYVESPPALNNPIVHYATFYARDARYFSEGTRNRPPGCTILSTGGITGNNGDYTDGPIITITT